MTATLTATLVAVAPAFAGPAFVTADRAAPRAASDGRSEPPPMSVAFAYDS